MTRNIKIWALGLALIALGGSVAYFCYLNSSTGVQRSDTQLGTAYQESQWGVISAFTGFQTKLDPSKINDGGNPNGQNTSINDGDRISNRSLGYELFPTTATYATTSPVVSTHNFRKRSGESIMMITTGGYIKYFEEDNQEWETLGSGFSSDDWDFADYNITTDQTSWTYFGNAVNNFSRWNGGHSLLTSDVVVGTNTLRVLSTDGFSATGTVMYCATSSAYTSKTATSFVLTGTALVNCLTNKGVAQGIETFPSNPKGNIYMVADNRLFIAGITLTPQAIYFSGYGSSTNFIGAALITYTTAANPGIFNLGEGGGGVTAMSQDESSLYFFKKSIIYKASISDSLYTLASLKTFDGKSQTIGAAHKRGVFASGNSVFFITPDNQIMSLQRVQQVDYPQTTPISDMIMPTVDIMSFASSTGITYKDKAYFSVKATVDSQINDTVLVWDIKGSFWDSPIVGWNASDFMVYGQGGEENLYFGDAFASNIFKVVNSPTDYIYDTKSNWRSKQFSFGLPAQIKELDNIFVEGYISPNTDLTISLLLDENGFTQKYSTTFKGNESAYLFNTASYNLFGFTPFGTERFGTNPDQSGKVKFRAYLNKGVSPIPFYTAQIEFASDGSNQQWEITNFGFHWRPSSNEIRTNLFRQFK